MNLFKSATTFLALSIAFSSITHAEQPTAPQPPSAPQVVVPHNTIGYYAFASAAALFAVSLVIYKKAFPQDLRERPNGYNFKTIKKSVSEIAHGKNVKANLKTLRKQLYHLYIDGFCGHAGKVGSPRENEKKGFTEIPYIESRGFLGWAGDQIDPFLLPAEVVGKTCVYLMALDHGKNMWNKLYDQGADWQFVDNNSSYKPSNVVKNEKPV